MYHSHIALANRLLTCFSNYCQFKFDSDKIWYTCFCSLAFEYFICIFLFGSVSILVSFVCVLNDF